MLRNTLNKLLNRYENSKLFPLFEAIDTFLFEVNDKTKKAPFIRDSIDVKRVMMLVVIALLPCCFMAIWNTGMQEFVYSHTDFSLIKEYYAIDSLSSYFSFSLKDYRYLTILKSGALLFLPVVFISYLVGGFWEILFSCVRKHPINEGLLVTALLYPLTLPSTIPYWMVALGISFGVVIGKEIFGGTGMNILNPALTSRAFLFFAFPAYMSGSMWVGGNPNTIQKNINTINQQVGYDAVSQESCLNRFNLSYKIQKIHTDAITAYEYNKNVSTLPYIKQKLETYSQTSDLLSLSSDEFKEFMTTSIDKNGLGLSQDQFTSAQKFVDLKYGKTPYTNKNLLLGNRIGSMGETSIIACIIGALFLLITGVASWRIMISVITGVFVTGSLFYLTSYISPFAGATLPALFDFPIYKHYLMGSIAFGLVFMATDPVSAPTMARAKYYYGLLIGAVIIVIRLINPAYPEGVMLAILFGNVFSPLLDYIAVRKFRSRKIAR